MEEQWRDLICGGASARDRQPAMVLKRKPHLGYDADTVPSNSPEGRVAYHPLSAGRQDEVKRVPSTQQ